MAKTGRNDLCPCGSGKKYKKCHETLERGGTARSRLLMIVVGATVLAAIAAGVAQFTGDRGASGGGRTWDPAHGHYHDSNGVQVP